MSSDFLEVDMEKYEREELNEQGKFSFCLK